MGRAGSVPFTLLTGFLGAGKTTLLNRLLAQPAFGGAAVVVNEFGDIGVDHLLVERVEGDRLTLTTGCVCCAARGDLLTALHDLLLRRAGGAVSFDRLLVETTGIADPGPIVGAVLSAPGLQEAVRLASLICVVDARDGLDVLDRHEEARRQAAMADVLVLSKLDLLDEARPNADLASRLARLNPLAAMVDGRDLGTVVEASAQDPARASPRIVPDQHGTRRHGHGSVGSVALCAGTVDPRAFDAWLATVLDRHGAALLRLKGLVGTREDAARPVLVQAVGARLHEVTRLAGWPDDDRTTRLVVIADARAIAGIAQLWDSFFGPPSIDRPDAAALMADSAGPGLF